MQGRQLPQRQSKNLVQQGFGLVCLSVMASISSVTEQGTRAHFANCIQQDSTIQNEQNS